MEVEKAGVLFSLFFFSVFLKDCSKAAEECITCAGEDYRGKISTTESGYTCQRWDSQKPHTHDYVLSTLPEKNLEKNYCRNPNASPRPWCFTTNPSKRWEYCSIFRCTTEPPAIAPELTCTTGDGSFYRGTISVTKSGKTCQSWTSQTPHEHILTQENYPCKGLEKNYCRNPNHAKAPWCFTTDPETRWEYCNVPNCGDQPRPECITCAGEDYRGKISTTESGYTCQRWDSQEPHTHDYVLSILPEKNLEENYCRNPNASPRPWCFTTDPSKRWEFCSIPRCKTEPPAIAPELTCTTGDGSFYRGTISVTKSGKTCQSWTSQTPHEHDKTQENYPCKDLKKNYCRNPNHLKAPWCFTTDPETSWEYCNVPNCGDQPRPECIHCAGEDYKGKISTTVNGYTCQRWDSQEPHTHDYVLSVLYEKNLEENYCRNPNASPRPWCFTTDPSKRWEYCSIPRCTTEPPAIVPELTCTTGDGSFYRGRISVTKSGKTCQSWTSQTPHEHIMTQENYPCTGLDKNYCRNPNHAKAPWCFTTDPETPWEYCNVPNCGDQPGPDKLKCGQPAIEPKCCIGQRVVGGCVSRPYSWPWQISLRISLNKNHYCGGSLIDAQWVLTAAHCLRWSQSPFAYKIFLGIHTQRGNEPSRQERDLSKIVIGPPGADIALLKLERPAVINDKVSPACLPEKDYIVPDGTDCFVTGWGETQGTGGDGYLKETGLPVIENKICNSPSFLNGRVYQHEMCAGNIQGGTDSCQGDSGGPLVCKEQNKFVLQGVTSWGIGCANAMKPGVYVRVSKFVKWIEQSMKEN